jgi:hypothetical protein
VIIRTSAQRGTARRDQHITECDFPWVTAALHPHHMARSVRQATLGRSPAEACRSGFWYLQSRGVSTGRRRASTTAPRLRPAMTARESW